MFDKDHIRIGVIGWGRRGRILARIAAEVTGGLLKAVAYADPGAEMVQVRDEPHSNRPRRYHNASAMLAEESLDGVLICSPNDFHLGNLTALKGSRLPILLEKPLESSFKKICEVLRYARTYTGPIVVSHCMRYAPILREAERMLKRGDIGPVSYTHLTLPTN